MRDQARSDPARNPVVSEAMNTLTTDVILAGFAVALWVEQLRHRHPRLCAILRAAPATASSGIRREATVQTRDSGIGRVFLLAAAFTPFLGPVAIRAFVGLIALHQAMISGCTWNLWMRDLVPDEVRGPRFFGIAANTALAMVVARTLGADLARLWEFHLACSSRRLRNTFNSGRAGIEIPTVAVHSDLGLSSVKRWSRTS